ncbi:hypothetical protein Xcel_2825 [Xylanimonas cellulosilytica DSM 15894]|uniref:HicB family toxin-antitoxin system n=1 Tax=Xylanimonas cellulosilytica (strain DSM 15894 / JCM 12276 / CECT 5975 / KCTC 9989 / LMG 20990 / NBRC 107835 / XIL07) TaxID=446471 RepID=D1BYG7_XYLCX|nr:hypothetical protein [Xylanimonas cellulosilytica]ACZ31839.1 hypothetical protein Xcel_2825 [Xylanimonas cellulosilytica DSM 15894]
MAEQVKYTVTVTREGRWWVGVVAGVSGAATETSRLADLEIEVRDLLAGLTDQDDDAFELQWDLSAVVGTDGQTMWEAFVAEREALDAARQRFEADRLATLRALASAGVSVRDSAALVDLSHQRVAQLLHT